jgi:hypothetical protein
VRKQTIILMDEIVPPPALVRAGLDALPTIIRAKGERASRRFLEFFTANIRNRNTRAAYARAVKQFFDWTDKRHLELREIEATQLPPTSNSSAPRSPSPPSSSTWRRSEGSSIT